MKRLLPALLLLCGAVGAWAIVAHRTELKTIPPPAEAPLVTTMRAEPQALRLNVRSQGLVRRGPGALVGRVAVVHGVPGRHDRRQRRGSK